MVDAVKKISRLKLDPMAQLVLSDENFQMGPRFAATGVTEIVRGVVDTMNLVSQATKITYRPRSAQSNLVLAHEGGYEADFQRAIVDAMVLADAAAWRFDFLRPIDDTLSLNSVAGYNNEFVRSIEQAMVLNSTAVNKTTFLRTLTQVLSLTDNVKQSAILESVLTILLLDHQAGFKRDFLRQVSHNLALTDSGSEVALLVRSLESVLLLDQAADVNADFVRDVSSLLTLVDDAVRVNAILEAAASVLSLTPEALVSVLFDRSSPSTLSMDDEAEATLVTACEQLDWTLIGDNPDGPQWGKALLPLTLALSRGTLPESYWTKYVQCYNSNLTVSEPPASTYGGAGPTGLSGSNKWRGGVLSEAGYLYFIPSDNVYTYKFDPSTNTGANLTTSHSGTLKWAGGALGFSGNIVCAPDDATTVLHINTSNDAETTFGTFTGTSKWHGAYLNKNGIAICAPRTSSQILAINPDSTANDVWLSTGPTAPGLACGQMAPDGVSLYVAPSSSTQVLKCNTADHTNITWDWLAGGPYGGSDEYFGMVLDDTGNIYCIPYDATAVLKIETQNGDNETTFGTITGTAKYTGGALGHDTKIYSAFWNAGNCIIIRTSNDTIYTMNTWNGSSARTCGINALPDGRLIPINANIPAIPRYYTDAGATSREADFLLSPYWNKL